MSENQKEVTTTTLQYAANLLREGKLVAFPTETVYGLGAIVSNPTAIRKVFEAKGRSFENPVNLTLGSIDMAERYVEGIPPLANQLMNKFWPGPLTIVLNRNQQTVPDIVTAGHETVALRMPDQIDTLQLIQLVGEAIVGPSANTSGRPSPTAAHHVAHDLGSRVDFIVNGGPSKLGMESTIIDLSKTTPLLLRVGEISQEAIESVIGSVEVNQALASANQPIHYQPLTPVKRITGSVETIQKWIEQTQENHVGWALPEAIIQQLHLVHKTNQRIYNMGATVKSYKQNLYDVLRQADNDQLDYIVLYELSETPESSSLIQKIRLISEGNLKLP